MSDKYNLELDKSSVLVAKRLLGCFLIRKVGNQHLVGKIVETEAYDQNDAASHSYKGQTARTSVMFGQSGFSYVYFTYGMHYCFNVVTGRVGQGSAVLIRALEPIEGLNIMAKNRGFPLAQFIQKNNDSNKQKMNQLKSLCNGPAKLCQALKINSKLNSHNLDIEPLKLTASSPLKSKDVVQTTRIGINRDKYRLWRFYIKDNLFISRK